MKVKAPTIEINVNPDENILGGYSPKENKILLFLIPIMRRASNEPIQCIGCKRDLPLIDWKKYGSLCIWCGHKITRKSFENINIAYVSRELTYVLIHELNHKELFEEGQKKQMEKYVDIWSRKLLENYLFNSTMLNELKVVKKNKLKKKIKVTR